MFGFGRLAMVLGAFEPVSGYGDGYTSTLTAITAVFGAHTSTILWGNLALGALLPRCFGAPCEPPFPTDPWQHPVQRPRRTPACTRVVQRQ